MIFYVILESRERFWTFIESRPRKLGQDLIMTTVFSPAEKRINHFIYNGYGS